VRVALFATCITDAFFPETAKSVVRLLERLGCAVEFPLEQTCCGQMHFNTGYADQATTLAERYRTVFADYDAVVAPSGSCAGMVRDVYPRLGAEESTGPRTYELAEFLIDVLDVQDVGARPLRLLRAVRGLDLVELPAAESCCGFGGTFAIKNADTSTAMLGDKMRAVASTKAEVLTAGDNSCLMHIGGGLSRLRAGIRPVHLAEILASTEEEPWTPSATR
jgi:L-lactate dehydrogenase complex protein LldE